MKKLAKQEAAPATTALAHALGRLRFTLAGEDRIAAALRDEFEPVRAAPTRELPHLELVLGPSFPVLKDATRVDPVVAVPDAYRAAYSRLRYHVHKQDGRYRCFLFSTFSPREFLPGPLQRALNWNYLTSPENQAKNFMYAVFDYLSQAAQLPLGQSYVHASSFARDGKGVAVVAWGGVGKTTAMLKLVSEHGWEYLSDDLGILDEDGVLHRSPKRMQVYAYNVANEPQLGRLLARGRSGLDRLCWHARRVAEGPKRVRRRVSAEEFFGPTRTARSAPLTDVFFLERAETERFVCRPLALDELAHRASATLLREFEPYHVIASALHTAGCTDVLPSPGEFEERSRAVLKRAFGRVRPLQVRVPLRAGPDDLSRYLLGLIES